jgi:hypothetical protein
MLIPEVALRFRSEDDSEEPIVIATTSTPAVVRTVATELVREAEAAAAAVAGDDHVLGQLLGAEVQRLRAVCAAVQAPPGELRLLPLKSQS